MRLKGVTPVFAGYGETHHLRSRARVLQFHPRCRGTLLRLCLFYIACKLITAMGFAALNPSYVLMSGLEPNAAATFDSRGLIYLKSDEWDPTIVDYSSA